jgi:hypothetical protein
MENYNLQKITSTNDKENKENNDKTNSFFTVPCDLTNIIFFVVLLIVVILLCYYFYFCSSKNNIGDIITPINDNIDIDNTQNIILNNIEPNQNIIIDETNCKLEKVNIN